MPVNVVMQGASEKVAMKRVKFTGNSTLKAGYAVCYNRDSTTGDSAGAADMNRAWEVEKPATANLKDFAGLVAHDYPAVTESGVSGQMIEIIEPRKVGTVCNGWTGISCTLGTTMLAVKNGTYTLEAAGASEVTVAKANQTVNRATTEGNCQVILYGGAGADIDVAAAVTVLAGGTTGGTDTLAGGTAGAPADILNVTSRVEDIITALKNANIMAS